MINPHTVESNYSQSSSLDEEKEAIRRETERQALTQLEKAKVCFSIRIKLNIIKIKLK